MRYFKKYLPYILIFVLFFSAFTIWSKVYSQGDETDLLTVAFLDVGQGDSIFIEAPNGKQMLIDGGQNGRVLQKLGEVMPFGDRSIDVVLATHADMDHVGGLSYVLDKYKISNIIENGVDSETSIYKELEEKVVKKKINKVIASRGMRIILDKEKNIYFDILYPDKNVDQLESNDGSIVGKLIYGEQSFMLTGDAPIYSENMIGWNESSEKLKSQILKLGHHGSKTSSSILWLEEVAPELAIISVDKNNRYGHPHQEIVDRLDNLKIPYLTTYQEGNIIFKTDGFILQKE